MPDKKISKQRRDNNKPNNGSAWSSRVQANKRNRFRIIAEILPFALATVLKTSPLLVICLTLITVLSGLTPAVTVYVGKLVLNAIITITQDARAEELRTLTWVLALQLAVFVAAALLSQAGSYLSYFMARRLSLNMKGDVIKRASRLDYAFFEDPYFYDMMTRAQRETDGKPMVIVSQVTSLVRGGIIFASMAGLIITLSAALFIAMVIVCIPLLLIRLRYGEKNYSLQFSRTEDKRMAEYTAGIMMARKYVPEILSFRLCRHLFAKWSTAAHRFFRQDVQLQRQRTIAETITWVLVTCSTVGATGYIIYVNIAKSLSLTAGEIMMYSAAFSGGISGLRVVLEGVSGIYENAIFLHNLVEFNKLKPRIEISNEGKPVPARVESIELRNVSFRYPGADVYALKNVSITFKRSQGTLIVGTNGAGKTTLIKLLTRLYDPTAGRILLNGTDIRQFEIQSLRRTIGIIFQDFIQYAFSARENVGYGSIENLQDTDRILNAARQARADSFLTQLPRQYDTILSKLFKNGQELSRGQWQRMCLARLFMKNAPVFVLDEPTANLDIETEAHLLQEIAHLSRDKICIFVSHRMFRKDICGQIVVLSKGRLLEAGSYDSLVARGGEFSRLSALYHSLTEKDVACSL